MTGWIKLSKNINTHWIWKDPIKFQWWIDILLTVNYSDTKIPIGFKVFDCKRGETLLSLLSWSKRWNVSKSIVNNFFTMLENDNMIKTVNETVTTRLIVCNYESYQSNENAFDTQTKRKQNAKETQDDTIKEETKEEKDNKENIKDIIDYLNFKTKKAYKNNSVANIKIITARLKENYTLEDFKKVIDNKTSKWLNDEKMSIYLRPETLFGNKFEAYHNENKVIKTNENKPIYARPASDF